MAYETLITEVEGHVATITLNRPDALNAFNNQLMDELTKALDTLPQAQTSRKCAS